MWSSLVYGSDKEDILDGWGRIDVRACCIAMR